MATSGRVWGEAAARWCWKIFWRPITQAGLDVSVVTNAAHYLRGKPAEEELPRCRSGTTTRPRCRNDHKGVALLASPPSCRAADPRFIKETERAIRQLGLKGIFIHSSHKGHYPDDDEARPFWELVQDLDVPVMIHPPNAGFGEERMREYRLASSIGRPFDLCLALGRLIVRGVFEVVSAAEDRRIAWRRRHLRNHQPHGLCLRAAGRGVLPRALCADEDQAEAEPLSENDVSRHRHLQRAGA